jgi:hypothetical protein
MKEKLFTGEKPMDEDGTDTAALHQQRIDNVPLLLRQLLRTSNRNLGREEPLVIRRVRKS